MRKNERSDQRSPHPDKLPCSNLSLFKVDFSNTTSMTKDLAVTILVTEAAILACVLSILSTDGFYYLSTFATFNFMAICIKNIANILATVALWKKNRMLLNICILSE